MLVDRNASKTRRRGAFPVTGALSGAMAGEQHLPDREHLLHLCARPLRFPPVDAATSVFYDEALRQVFTVRGGGMHVTVSSLGAPDAVGLSFPSRGPVVSMKFSLDKRILAIQRTSRTIVRSCRPRRGLPSNTSLLPSFIECHLLTAFPTLAVASCHCSNSSTCSAVQI